METPRTQDEFENGESQPSRGSGLWLGVLAVVALIAAVIAFGYGLHQQATVNQLNARATETNETMGQMREQVDALTTRVGELSAAAQAAQAAQASAPVTQPGVKKRAVVDRRYRRLESQLKDQQDQLRDTQQALDKTRSDLEGNLDATRDDLNGSIARTHDELVSLEKKGERDYFEFDLSKSKQFQHAGPILISLRKADTKHKSYNLAMIVDDNQLRKNNVDLYEPIWLHAGDATQPVQVVVNRITKNHVHGYVSAPKYSESRNAPTITPVSEPTPPANTTPPAPPPSVPPLS